MIDVGTAPHSVPRGRPTLSQLVLVAAGLFTLSSGLLFELTRVDGANIGAAGLLFVGEVLAGAVLLGDTSKFAPARRLALGLVGCSGLLLLLGVPVLLMLGGGGRDGGTALFVTVFVTLGVGCIVGTGALTREQPARPSS